MYLLSPALISLFPHIPQDVSADMIQAIYKPNHARAYNHLIGCTPTHANGSYHLDFSERPKSSDASI